MVTQTTTSSNGTKPKLDLQLNQPVRIKLLKPSPYIGENRMGKYYLYSVADENGIEMAYFATEPVHNLIQTNQLKVGSLIQLTKKARGIEFSIIGQAVPEPTPAAPLHVVSAEQPAGDRLKEIMLQSLQDAIEIAKALTGAPFQGEDIRSIANCLFIARTR